MTDPKKKFVKYSKMKTIHSQINSNLFHGDALSDFDHKFEKKDPLNSSLQKKIKGRNTGA